MTKSVDAIREEIERIAADFYFGILYGFPGAQTAAPPRGESYLASAGLLEIAERWERAPMGAAGGGMNIGGIPIVVSEAVPTTEDRLRLDGRPLWRRIFSGQLCGVRVETVACDHVFLVNRDWVQFLAASTAAAAMLRLFPEEDF